jgi:hypothetical protein
MLSCRREYSSSHIFDLFGCKLGARLFKDIRMKALAQDVRFKVFSIIDTLMAKHREGISLFPCWHRLLTRLFQA